MNKELVSGRFKSSGCDVMDWQNSCRLWESWPPPLWGNL